MHISFFKGKKVTCGKKSLKNITLISEEIYQVQRNSEMTIIFPSYLNIIEFHRKSFFNYTVIYIFIKVS